MLQRCSLWVQQSWIDWTVYLDLPIYTIYDWDLVRTEWRHVFASDDSKVIRGTKWCRVWSLVSIQTQSLALRKRKPQETQALVLASSQLWFSRNKRKRQPIGMLGRSSGNHDWMLVNASACVSCGFRLRNARNASDCVWREVGPRKGKYEHPARIFTLHYHDVLSNS